MFFFSRKYIYNNFNKAINISEINYEQDRQCTYNVTLRRVRVTIVAMEKQ
jgi:hypothetical protein